MLCHCYLRIATKEEASFQTFYFAEALATVSCSAGLNIGYGGLKACRLASTAPSIFVDGKSRKVTEPGADLAWVRLAHEIACYVTTPPTDSSPVLSPSGHSA